MELTASLFEQVLRTLRSDANTREQRRHPRVGLRARTSIYHASTIEPIIGWVRDLSLQGIGLSLPAPLEVGSRFELRMVAHGGELLRIQYVVVRSRSLGTVYSVGGKLERVDAPPGVAPFLPPPTRQKPVAMVT